MSIDQHAASLLAALRTRQNLSAIDQELLDVLARRSSAVAKPQADAPPETVKLERGLGAKARFNGQSATLGAKSAGWTNAVVNGTPVKWRTGHWSTPLMPTSNCFLLLADTLLLKIMRLLDTPSVCNLLQADRTFSALRSEAPFAECHLCMGVPNGFGVVPSKQLRFAAELGRAHAPLTSMRVDVGRDELTVLRWVLQNCDTEQLATVRINAFEERKGQMLLSLLHQSGPIDCSAPPASDCSEQIQAFRSGLRPLARDTTCRALATFCPAITSLSLIRMVDDVPSLAMMKSLQRLEANFLEVDDINYILSELPRLTHLTVTGGNHPELASSAIDLVSDSLEVIDLSHASKGLTIEQIACPKLRQIRCRESGPNGLVVGCHDHDGEVVSLMTFGQGLPDLENFDGDSPCRFYALSPHGAGMDENHELELPLECEVVIDTGRGMRWGGATIVVTSSTTVREFYAALPPTIRF